MADLLSPLPGAFSPRSDAHHFSPRPESNAQESSQAPSTIRIADDTHPKDLQRTESAEHRFRPLTRSDTTALAGGIYNTRALGPRSASLSRQHSIVDRGDGDGEEGDDWRDGEKPKIKQVYRGTTLLWLAYQSVGAIYGDIGTSPLYVFSSTFTQAPDYESLLQVLSLVLWSLSIMVTLKYVFLILRADNEGEGGTFSCYSLLTRFVSSQCGPRSSWLLAHWLIASPKRPILPNATPASRSSSTWSGT